MALTQDDLDRIRYHLGDAVKFEHLARYEWRLQTDLIKQTFAVAALCMDLGKAGVLVDGRISDDAARKALATGDIKAYFNRRFHDAGLSLQRVIVFDTVSSNLVRGSTANPLHFHAVLEFPARTSWPQFQALLKKVFGAASGLGKRQFNLQKPDWTKSFAHNGAKGTGPVGKLLYAVKNAGNAYRVLKLNADEKRSRCAPSTRGKINARAVGLARGIGSNFNQKVVLCDRKSMQRGKVAFDGWIRDEKAKLKAAIASRNPEIPARAMAAKPKRKRDAA